MLSKWDIASSIVPYQAGSSAQRIRIGLTGLAFAFIIVLLGSAILRSSHDDNVTAANAVVNEPNEPLAELGVAPGAENSANNSSSSGNATNTGARK